jgi:hypothetical protein
VSTPGDNRRNRGPKRARKPLNRRLQSPPVPIRSRFTRGRSLVRSQPRPHRNPLETAGFSSRILCGRCGALGFGNGLETWACFKGYGAALESARSVKRLLPLVLLASVAVACGGGGSGEQAATPPLPPSRDARCVNVPASVVRAIATGLTVEGGGSLRFAQAVKSSDFASVYFVSADIQGSGLEGSDDVGTWATNRLALGGLIFAVDGVAQEFSDWGHGDTTDADMTMADDGGDLSTECVQAVATP